MTNKRRTQENFLLQADVLINNALSDPEIINVISSFGYDEKKIREGQKLLNETITLQREFEREYGEQYEATNKLYEAKDKANNAYMKALKIARIAFKNNVNAQAALHLTGERKESFAGWLKQAESFYSNLLASPDFLSEIGKFGFNQNRLKNETTLISAVKEAKYKQEKETGEAQQATQDRDTKLDKLSDWISDFRAVCRVAFEENPQQLEKLGIVVKS